MDQSNNSVLVTLGELKGLVTALGNQQSAMQRQLDRTELLNTKRYEELETRVAKLERQRAWLIGATAGACWVIYDLIPHFFQQAT